MTAEIILLSTIVLLASLLQTSTGYGFSIIGSPFLLLLFPVHEAIQINIVLSICLSIFLIYKIRREVDLALLTSLIKGSSFGLIAGIFIYLYLKVSILKFGVGLLIVVLTVLLLLKLSIKQTYRRDLAIGGISGLLTTSIGIPGPPLLLYFSAAKIDKVTLRSTTLAYYLFVYTASLIMQISFGGTSKTVWLSSITAIPALFTGIILGQILFNWISEATFKIITYLILGFTGIYLFVTSLFSW